MVKRSQTRAFTIVDLLVVIAVIGILLGLLMRAAVEAREAMYRDQCQCKIKQIALALLNHESAYRRFPLIFNAPESLAATGNTPQAYLAAPAGTGSSSSPAKMTGWSWIVRTLPYFCESNLYKTIDIDSAEFSLGPSTYDPAKSAPSGPFDKAIVNGSAPYQHCSCVMLDEFICPAWFGGVNTNGSATIDTTGITADGTMPTGAPEYAKLQSMEPTAGAPQGFVDLPAPTNYKAIVGTHLQTSTGANPNAPVENGGMLLSAKSGSTISMFSDGTANTLMVAETKECGYASWYDGAMNWLVTNSPSAKVAPGTNDSPPWINAQVAINQGYNPALSSSAAATTNVPYLSSAQSINGIKGNENWGPSSDHANGAVMHAFADDHVEAITDQCDPQTYLNLTTRAGAESIVITLVR